MTFYTHWRDVPKAAWRWPKFLARRDRLPRTGKLLVNKAALGKLQALRLRLSKPLIVLSAYRSPAVRGAKASKHMEGIAFDIAMANHDPEAFEAAARAVGFQGFGFYPRSGFMHIDLWPARSWGERFPYRPTAFAAETPPAREVLAESRTLKGGGAAGVATVGAAGMEVAQQVLAETQGAVMPLVPNSTPSAGCSSPSLSAALPWRSTPGSTIGSRASGDRRSCRRPRWQPPYPERAALRSNGGRGPPAPPRLPPLRRAARPTGRAPRSGENQ